MHFDTHPDLIVQPYLNGVKLVKPKESGDLFPSIGSLFALQLINYFVNFDGEFIDGNHLTRITNIPGNQGYYSDKDLKKTPLRALFTKDAAENLNYNNNNILQTKRLTVYEELSTRLDEICLGSLSFKYPVYDAQAKVVAVFGMSCLTNQSTFKEALNLSDSMELILQTGLIPRSKNIVPGFTINEIYFTKQEIKCLRLLVSGKTMKLIGQHLGLSVRTVEFYLNNIKQKLQVKTKSELIEKVVGSICPEILL